MRFIKVNLKQDIYSENEILPKEDEQARQKTEEIEQDAIFNEGHSNNPPIIYTTKRHIEIASVAYKLVDNFHHHINSSLNSTSFNDTQAFRISHQGLEHNSATNESLTNVGKQAFIPAMMPHLALLMPTAIQAPFIAAPKVAMPSVNAPLSQEASIIDESPSSYIVTRALVDLPKRDTKFSLGDLEQENQVCYTHTLQNVLNEIKIKETAQNIFDTNTTQWNMLVHTAKENRFTDNTINNIVLELNTQNLIENLQNPNSSLEKDAIIDQIVDILFDEQYIAAHETYETIADLLGENEWLNIAKEAFHVDYELAIEDEQYIVGEFLKVKFSETTLQSMLDEFLEDVEEFDFDHDILEAEILELSPSESTYSVQQLSLQEKLAYRDFLEEIVPRIRRDQLLIANGETDDLPDAHEIIETVETDDFQIADDETSITTFSEFYNKIANMFDSIYGNGAFDNLSDNTNDLPLTKDDETELEHKVDSLFERIMNLLDNADDTDIEEFCDISPEHQWSSYETIDHTYEPASIYLNNYEEIMKLSDPSTSSSTIYHPVSVEDIDILNTSEDFSFNALFEQLDRIDTLHAEAYPISIDKTFDDFNSALLDSVADLTKDSSNLDLNTLLSNLPTTSIEPEPFDMMAFFCPTDDSTVDLNALFPATALF